MSKALGGIAAALALILGACGGSASADDRAPEAVPVTSTGGGYDPEIYTEDPWQLGYCISVENDSAEVHEVEGGYGTGSYEDLLADRPCTLDLAFGYGKLLKKHNLVGNENYIKIWKVLSDKEPGFRDKVVQFSDGYAENFVNR